MSSRSRSSIEEAVKVKTTKPPKPEIVIVMPKRRKEVDLGTFGTNTEPAPAISLAPPLPSMKAVRGDVEPTPSSPWCDIETAATIPATTIIIAHANHSDDHASTTPTAASADEATLCTPPPRGQFSSPYHFNTNPSSPLSTSQRDYHDRRRSSTTITPMMPLTPATPATIPMSASTTTPTPTAHSPNSNSYFPSTPASASTCYTVFSSTLSNNAFATYELKEQQQQPSEQEQGYHQREPDKGAVTSYRPTPPDVPPLTIPLPPLASSPRPPIRRQRPPYSRTVSSSSSTPSITTGSTTPASSRGPPTTEALQSMSEWRRIQYEEASAGAPPASMQDDPLQSPVYHHTSSTIASSPLSPFTLPNVSTFLPSLKMQPHRPAATLLTPISTNFNDNNATESLALTMPPPTSAFPQSGPNGGGSSCGGGEDNCCNLCGCFNPGSHDSANNHSTKSPSSDRSAAVHTPSSVMTFGPNMHAFASNSSSMGLEAPFKYLQQQAARSFPHHLQTQQPHPLSVYTSNLNFSSPMLSGGGMGSVGATTSSNFFMLHGGAAAAVGSTATLGSECFDTAGSVNTDNEMGPHGQESPGEGSTTTSEHHAHPYHPCHRHQVTSACDSSISSPQSLSHSISAPNLRQSNHNQHITQQRKHSVCSCISNIPSSNLLQASSITASKKATSSVATFTWLAGNNNGNESGGATEESTESISSEFARSSSRRRLKVATSFVVQDDESLVEALARTAAAAHGDDEGENGMASATGGEHCRRLSLEDDGHEGQGCHSSPTFCQPLLAVKDCEHSVRGSTGEAMANNSLWSDLCGCSCHGNIQGKGTATVRASGRRQSVRSGDLTSEYMADTTSVADPTIIGSQSRPSKERKSSSSGRLYLSGLKMKHKQNKLHQRTNSGSGGSTPATASVSGTNSKSSKKRNSKGAKNKDWTYNFSSSYVRQEFAQYNYERQIQDFQRAAQVFKEQKDLTTAAAAAAIVAQTRAAVAESQAEAAAANAKKMAKKKRKEAAQAAAAASKGKASGIGAAGLGEESATSSIVELETRGGLPSPIQEEVVKEGSESSISALAATEELSDNFVVEAIDEKPDDPTMVTVVDDATNPTSLSLPPSHKPAIGGIHFSALHTRRREQKQKQSRSRPAAGANGGGGGSGCSSYHGNKSNVAIDMNYLELAQVCMNMMYPDMRSPRLRLGSNSSGNSGLLASKEVDRCGLQDSMSTTDADKDSHGPLQPCNSNGGPAEPFENAALGEVFTSNDTGCNGTIHSPQRLGMSGGGGTSPRPPFRRADDSNLPRSSIISRDGGSSRYLRSSTLSSNAILGGSGGRSLNSVCSVTSVSQQIAARHQEHAAAVLGLTGAGGDLVPPSPSFIASSPTRHSHLSAASSAFVPLPPSACKPSSGVATPELIENSPVQVVRATVGTVDDTSLPCLTFRMWVLSTLFVALGAISSEYNFFRTNSAYFSVYFVQLASYFCGKAMARWLPTRSWTIRLDFRPLVACWDFLFVKTEDDKQEEAKSSHQVTPSNGSIRGHGGGGNNSLDFNSENSGMSEIMAVRGSGRNLRGAAFTPLHHVRTPSTGGAGASTEPVFHQFSPPNRLSGPLPKIGFQYVTFNDMNSALDSSSAVNIGDSQSQPHANANCDSPRRTAIHRSRKNKGLFKWTFTLNNGKFNMKEHMLIGVAAAAGSVPAYATNVLAIQAIVFDAPLGKLTGIGLVISSQCIGYSLAWCLFDFVIKPSVMLWPATLVNVSLYNTLHEHKVLTRWFTRMQLFWYAFFAVFIYQWLPRLIAPVLTSMALLCWINPKSNVLRKLGSGFTGLGIGCISLDWSIISGVGPLYTPWWAQANFFFGLIVMLWIITPLVYFSNYWSAQSYPIVSSNLYDQDAELYDITKIVNEDLTFNETMYDNYSPVMMTPYFAITYGTCFMAVIATFTHVALFYGADITHITTVRIQQWKQRMQQRLARLFGRHNQEQQQQQYPSCSAENPCGVACQHTSHSNDHRAQIHTAMFGTEDIHTRLMRAYADIPGFWFAVLFFICFAMAVLICNDSEIQLPFYALILGFLLAAVFALPMAIIQALSSSQVGLNVLSEVVCGYILPGNQLGNSVFKCYSYMALFQCLNLTQSFKLGHYMKVGPRHIFIVVLYGTILGAVLNVQVLEWILNYNREDLFSGDPHSGWSLRNLDLFFSASLLWGAISPKRLFATGSLYHFLPYCFLIGLFLPLPFYIMFRLFPPANSTFPASAPSARSAHRQKRRRQGASRGVWPWSPSQLPSDINNNSQKKTEKAFSITCAGPLSACPAKLDEEKDVNTDEFCQDPTCGSRPAASATADDRSSNGKWWCWWRSQRVSKSTNSGRSRSAGEVSVTGAMDKCSDLDVAAIDGHQHHHHHHHHHRRRRSGSKFEYIDAYDEDLETGLEGDGGSNNDALSTHSRSSRSRRSPAGASRLSRIPWQLVNTPLICVGASFVPQAPASFVVSAGIVAFVFAFIVLRYRHEWWRRYTFVLAAALDAGTQICNMAIFVVFSLILADRVEFPQWAGNNKMNPERCGVGDGYN